MIKMKHSSLKRLASVLCGFLLCMPMLFAQQTITVKGKVIDPEKQPVIGAAIIQVGTTNGAATDVDGNFTLTCPAGADLEVSSIGYETVTVKAAANLTVTLAEENTVLDETVVVGYGTTKKASLTASIANIRDEELNATKSPDVTASLQGKVPGLLIRQVGGGAGDFDTDLSIRGYGEPIVVIDGVVRTTQRRGRGFGGSSYSSSSTAILSQLNPEDIESISVLKDASASLYGMGSQNGVILVTTKKGTVGKPSVRYTNTISFGVPTALPKESNVVDNLLYQNEEYVNVHYPKKYSDELIEHFRNGDPGYVDTRWMDEVTKVAFQQNHSLSVSGGNQQTQYYLSARYNQDKGIYNNPGLGYKAFNFQGNVTTKITNNLTAVYQSSFDTNNRVGMSATNTETNFWYYVALSERTMAPTVYGNPNHYTNASYENWNPVALLNIDLLGYAKSKGSSYNNSLDLKYEAPFLKGLILDAFASFNVSQRQTNNLDRVYDVYDYFTDELLVADKGNDSYSENWNKNQSLYGKLQANYNKRWEKHNLTAMVAAETRLNWSQNINASAKYEGLYTHDVISQAVEATRVGNGSRSSSATAGYLGRIAYDYQGKYLAEVTARYDGTYLYAPGSRWGFFPAYSLGWRMSDEPFFKRILPWMNNFKLRWSDGMTGQQQGSPYAWQLGYEQSGSYVFSDGMALAGYVNTKAAETILSWRRVRMMDFGIDFEVNRGIFGGSIDFFRRTQSGIAASSVYSSKVPSFYGISLPQYNLNKSENVGIDLQLSHRNRIGAFNYRITATATFARNRNTYTASNETATWGSHQAFYNSFMEGRWSNARSGANYHWVNGGEQFTGWADIYNYNIYMGAAPTDLLPGMYKIEDRNGDGVINSSDQYYSFGANADAFGFSGPGATGNNPPLQFGLMIFMNYKNFDLSATFNGTALDHRFISLHGTYGYGYYGTFYKNYEDHYHLADGYTDPFDPNSVWVSGFYPALRKVDGGYVTWGNGTYASTQPYNWMNAAYLRLKSIEIGYTLPNKLTSKIGLRQARFYVSGTNLLTICNKLLKPYDPERSMGWIGGGGNPLIKTYSFGVNINF